MSSHPDRQHYGITLAVLALGALAYALLQSLVAPALPNIQHSFDASESAVTWVLTAYLLSASMATPLVDMRIMRLRGVWTVNLAGFLLGCGMFASFILLPQLVELPEATGCGFQASVTGAGLFMLPSTVAMLLVGLIVVAVPADRTGVATGMNTIMRTIGGALGSQIVASILAANVIAASGQPAERGFTIAFWLAAGVLLIGVLAAAAIPGRREEQRALARVAPAGRTA